MRAGVALGSLLVVPGAWARSSAAAARKTLVRSRFTPLVGSTLRVTGGGDDLTVVLAEITDLIPTTSSEHQFGLLFKASRPHPVSEGIRTFHHSAIGRVDLFVSPVDRPVKERYYEAVINRAR